MKNIMASAALAFCAATTAQGAIVAVLEDGANDSVFLSIEVRNPDGFDYSGFSADHLQYIFVDDVGDYVN